MYCIIFFEFQNITCLYNIYLYLLSNTILSLPSYVYLLHTQKCVVIKSFFVEMKVNCLVVSPWPKLHTEKSPWWLSHIFNHFSWPYPDAGPHHLPLRNNKHWLKGLNFQEALTPASTWPLSSPLSPPSQKRIIWEITKIGGQVSTWCDWGHWHRFCFSGSGLINSVFHRGARSVVWCESGGSIWVRCFCGSCSITPRVWVTLSLEMVTQTFRHSIHLPSLRIEYIDLSICANILYL